MSSVLGDKASFTGGVAGSVLNDRDSFMASSGDERPAGWEDWWYQNVGPRSAAGVSVNHVTAQRHALVWACVNAISESIASLPLALYLREDSGDKRAIPQHPLHTILHDQANDEHTAVEFREMMQSWCTMRGWAAAEIVPGKLGSVGELLPLHPDDTRPLKQQDASGRGRWVFEYHPSDSKARILLRDEVFLIRSRLTERNSILGVDPISAQKESIGAALATQEFAARFFANDLTPSGILEHPTAFKDADQRDAFLAAWKRARTGSGRHGTAVLEKGLKFHQISLTQEQAQYLETRNSQKLDICSIFRVPPHKVGILADAKFKNIEQQAIEWVTDTLMPHLVRWEQAIKRDLITKTRVFAEHNVLGLLRGDIEARFKSYAIGRNWGWLSANDVRRLENQNSIGEDGNFYLQPLNMIPAGDAGEPSEQAPPRREQQAIEMSKKGQLWIPQNINMS